MVLPRMDRTCRTSNRTFRTLGTLLTPDHRCDVSWNGKLDHYSISFCAPLRSLSPFLVNRPFREERAMASVLLRSPSAGAWRRPCVPAHRAAARALLLARHAIAQVPDRAFSDNSCQESWLLPACCARCCTAHLDCMELEGRTMSMNR